MQVLVATDIAARGLDISELPQVVNYELPHVPEDYVHRIGRTGRAGCAGQALSLVSDDERDRLHAIERGLGKKISVLPLDRSNIKVVEWSDGGANRGTQQQPRGEQRVQVHAQRHWQPRRSASSRTRARGTGTSRRPELPGRAVAGQPDLTKP